MLLCLPLVSSGQDTLALEKSLVPERAIKFSPFHLINFYPTIEISYEMRIRPLFTLQAEGGYVLNYRYNTDEEFQNKRGIKGKLEARNYLSGPPDRRKQFYLAAEVYLNAINFGRQDGEEECFDLECNHRFHRRYNYKMKYREEGFSFKVGFIRYWGPALFLDINSGVTLRNVRYKEPISLRPRGGDVFFAGPDIPNEEDRVTVSPNLGIRLGYRLK